MPNLFLALTFISYLLLIPFHIETPKGTGDQNVGMLVIFYVFLAYVVLSLISTIIITLNGGFNWISSSTLWRNLGVGALWLGMIGGIFICMSTKAELGMGNKSTGIMRLLAYLFYYGGVWLPLFMFVSYFSMINPDGRIAVSPNWYKTLLLSSSAIGLVSMVAVTPIRKMIAANTDEYNTNLAMIEIDKAKTVEEQFWLTTKITDDRLLTQIVKKIPSTHALQDNAALCCAIARPGTANNFGAGFIFTPTIERLGTKKQKIRLLTRSISAETPRMDMALRIL